MNSKNAPALIYYACAIVFYILAAISHHDNSSAAITLTCTGTVFLCLGSMFVSKNKKKDDSGNSIDDSEDEK